MNKLLQTALLASFLLTITGTAAADTSIGIFPTGPDYEGRILVITGRPVGTVASACGITGPLFRFIMIPVDGAQPLIHDLILHTGDVPKPGDRFSLSAGTSCGLGLPSTVIMTPI